MFKNWIGRRHRIPSGDQTTVVCQPQLIPNSTPCSSAGQEGETLGPMGLRVIYQPRAVPIVDIIFIHGLGGGSKKTWSKDPRDPTLFWPQQWLPSEPEIGKARILSFGYNAKFLPGAPRSIYNIVILLRNSFMT